MIYANKQNLLKRRGYEEYLAGKISRTKFAYRLAQEWAELSRVCRSWFGVGERVLALYWPASPKPAAAELFNLVEKRPVA